MKETLIFYMKTQQSKEIIGESQRNGAELAKTVSVDDWHLNAQ